MEIIEKINEGNLMEMEGVVDKEWSLLWLPLILPPKLLLLWLLLEDEDDKDKDDDDVISLHIGSHTFPSIINLQKKKKIWKMEEMMMWRCFEDDADHRWMAGRRSE